MTFNLERAVTMLARIELGRLDRTWHQGFWATAEPKDARPPLDKNDNPILDEETHLPLGLRTCGTAHCAAGFVLEEEKIPLNWLWWDSRRVFYAQTTTEGQDIPDVAVEMLGIPVPPDAYDRLGWSEEEDGDEPREGADSHWDYEEGVPRMFLSGNTVGDIYDEVLHYAQADGLVSSAEALETLVTERVGALTQEHKA